MKTKLPSLVFFFGTLYINSRNSSKNYFSTKEVLSFSKIHKYKLEHPLDLVFLMNKLTKKSIIPEQRVRQFIKSQFSGASMRLSPEENKQFAKLKMILQSEEDKYDIKLNGLIKSKGLDLDVYKKMELAFLNNKSFKMKVLKLIKS
jgi:hypothetical protein